MHALVVMIMNLLWSFYPFFFALHFQSELHNSWDRLELWSRRLFIWDLHLVRISILFATEFMHDSKEFGHCLFTCKLDCEGHRCSDEGTVGAHNGTSWTCKPYSYFQYGSYFRTFQASRASTHSNRGGQSHIEQCSESRRVLDCRKFNIENAKSGTWYTSSFLTSKYSFIILHILFLFLDTNSRLTFAAICFVQINRV